MREAAVELADVTRRFGDLTALDGVSLEVGPGEVLALLGHNGAGKTTLLRIVSGLLRVDGGTVRTLGLDPIEDGQQVRESTGVLTEYPALDAFLTTRENLELHGRIHALSDEVVRERSTDLLEQLGLTDKADAQARSLSAGLKQRAALARALLHRPALLMLDEPTSNLDPLAARQVRTLVKAVAHEHGTAVVLCTHNLAEAAAVADTVAVLERGRLLAVGPPDGLVASRGVSGVAITVAGGLQERAAAELRAAGASVLPLQPDSSTVEVQTRQDGVPDLVSRLVKAGIDVHAVVPMAPSLEDVYVTLHAGSRS